MQEQPQPHCPNCGAPAPFRGTAVSLVCEYCNSTIVRQGVDIKLIGQVSALVDNGSPIILGSRGRFKGTPFEVSGRLQVEHGRGSWNEWFVNFADGNSGWLADAMGQFAIVLPKNQRVVAGRVPPYANVSVNSTIVIDGTAAVVVDRRAANYKGAEGILPFEAEPGMLFHGVDLRGHKGEFFSLDYGTDPNHNSPIPYVGEAITLGDVGLHPLRPFKGWRRPAPAGAPAPQQAQR